MISKPYTYLSCFCMGLSLPSAWAQENTTSLPALVITGQQTPYIRLSETATKTDLDLLDTPLSVNIVNENLMRDLQAETLADVYPYIVGLSQSGNNANSFTLRGLSSGLQNVQANGLPGLASRFGSPSTANIERVEVLKGPSSVLYGLMEPGGLVNIVTKKPEAQSSTSVSMSGRSYASENSRFGSDNGASLTFDTTGSASDDDDLLYRFIASAKNIDSFRDGVNDSSIYLYPTLTYQFTPEIKGTVGMEYVRERRDADDGLVAANSDINQTAPLSTRYQKKGDLDNDEGLVLFGHLENQLSDSTLFRLNLRSVYHEDERKLYENNRVSDAANISDASLRRRDRHQLNKREYHFVDANLSHKFETGALFHNLLVGINGGFERADFNRIRFGANVSPNISVLDPMSDSGVPVAIQSGNHRVTDYYNAGIYIQDTVDLNEHVSVMLGGRFDTQHTRFSEKHTDIHETQNTRKLLPQAGVVFRATDSVSLYASHTESFNPNSIERRAADGSSFDPELGSQNEIGIKAALLDDRLNLTVAGYKITKSNITERNSAGDYELLGELESTGYELELQALPVENWQIRVGYANVDSVVSASPNSALVGKVNAFAPRHNAFIWTRYNLPQQVWGGTVGASLGMNYQSKQFSNVNPASQVEMPGYTRTDLGFYYDLKQYRFAMNIENLFDKTYYTGGNNNTKLYPGAPRLITLSFKTTF
ncbi:TonB-dependent siderophore receptor [Nitrincola sp. MINF-07-Sa-05]|uniref:TonB-dependent siderophore receptor n=1 Tax=Nitrincola salilacus TaxID=3400273 RepID=UPI0039181AE9